jgi:hypothetical protein
LFITLLVILNLVQLILQISQFFSATSQTQISSSSMVASAVLILTFALAGFCGFVNKQMGVISSGTCQHTFCIPFLG